MHKTQNYNLNKPEVTDPLRVEDFNENANIIDKTLQELNMAVAVCGNCHIVAGTYVGNGNFGSSKPNALDFAGTLGAVPKFLLIMAQYSREKLLLTQGVTSQVSGGTNSCSVTWTSTGVKWFNIDSPNAQLNYQGQSYYYVALT